MIRKCRQAETSVQGDAPYRVSCDSIALFPPHTRGERPIFAKNSDRPDNECQPLLQVPSTNHADGEKLRCTYIEVDQVEHTYAFLGARPHWLWGCEHGVNENGVAIGNHTIYTRDPVPKTGLLGMDLVRLGLERARTAESAAEIIIELLERYGQGGSGYDGLDWAYHNSYLIADAEAGYLLETSDRNWALRRFTDRASASNHATIGTEWDRLSGNCEAHAREQGWWANEGERFDFAAAYRDSKTIPPFVSSGRYRTTSELTSDGQPADIARVKALMRDHYGDGQIYRPGVDPSTEDYFSVCMHAGAIGQTTSSMIVELGADEDEMTVCWVALGNPCMSVYLPVFPEADIPEPLLVGGKEPSNESAWFRFKRLAELVAKDFEKNAPIVLEHWAAYEAQLAGVTEEIAAAVEMGDLERGSEDRSELLEEFMNEAWAATAEQLDELEAKLA